MTRKVREYAINDPGGMNLKFYEQYDEAFLVNKATTLWAIVNSPDAFRKFAIDLGSNGAGITDKYFESLRAEIYFTEFHQFESFFALLMAMYQSDPHWLFLTTYDSAYIKQSVDFFLSNDAISLTNGKFDTIDDFITGGVYTGFAFDPQERWQQSLDNIIWLIKRMAEKYKQASERRNGEYNAYKHGLRVVTGEHSIALGIGDSPSKWVTLGASPDSVTFLEVEESEASEAYSVYITTRHFNPAESMVHLTHMMSFIQIMKSTRLANLNQIEDVSLVNIRDFSDMNRDEIKSFNKYFQWRTSA